jgi:hypothetical protein
LSRIVNCDETAWPPYSNGLPTWEERGSESIQAETNDNKNDSVKVLASVTAAGAKIPLIFIAAGKTGRVEQSQIGSVQGH